MGIFNFLKGNSNKPEYEDKPYEWFLSEEGRQSFLKYADNWRDMDAWLIEVGAWERGFEKVGRMCKSIDSPSERQKSWPCFYLYHFVKALKNKYKKNKDTKAEFSISRYFIFHNDIGMFLYYLSLMVPDDLNELKWPNFLTPEDNPLINYLIKCPNFLAPFKYANVVYIHEMACEDTDASKESWLYDIEEYLFDKEFNKLRTERDIRIYILDRVAHPENYSRILGE